MMIDHDGFQLNTRKALLENSPIACKVDVATTLGELYIAFQKDLYNVVIIDNTIENNEKYIEHLLQHDPKQPLLVVSDAVRCVINRCEDCVNNHNVRRLNNPTPIKNIVRMVSGFSGYSCDHYDPQTNLMPESSGENPQPSE